MGTSLIVNNRYMASIYFRQISPLQNSPTLGFSNTYSNIPGWGQNGTSTTRINQDDGWIRLYTQYLNTVETRTDNKFWKITFDTTGVQVGQTLRAQWCAPMIEQHDTVYPSTFVNGTRSNTQAILDLTNNNTITATSLTYENDGSFSFNSPTNFASVPYNLQLDLINTVTLEAWLKYTSSTNTVCIEKSSNNTHYQFQIFSSTQGSGIGGELVFMLQPNSNNWVVAGIGSNDNEWHHVVGTYNRSTSTARIYIDGKLKNTNSAIINGPTTNTQPLLIGSRSGLAGFGGSISNVRIYNRALSAEEIRQNFNALKGRYGL
jgi:hypothetical protein